jgi:hypothetical protein
MRRRQTRVACSFPEAGAHPGRAGVAQCQGIGGRVSSADRARVLHGLCSLRSLGSGSHGHVLAGTCTMRICDLYGWSSEKEPQKPQNDDVVCPLPRGRRPPKSALSASSAVGLSTQPYTSRIC